MVDKIASALAQKRWKKATAKDRTEAAQTMNAAKTPEQLRENAKKAAAARWANRKAKKAK